MKSLLRSDLLARSCANCPPGTPALSDEEIRELLGAVPGWARVGEKIQREYTFSNYMSGVRWLGVVATIAEQEDHHPDVLVSWGRVTVTLWTHTVNGLMTNDFIVAAKLDEAWQGFATAE